MMLFKACPKCHGDLHSGRDMYGTYLQCFQCGMMVDVTAVIAAKRSMEEKAKRQAA
jgi:DNA-directed RNA polymerase subunit M/transcription elongation factor TFIIS